MSRFLNARLQSMAPYTPGRQPKNMAGLIKLNTNESPFPPSPAVQKALDGAAGSLRLYCDIQATALRRQIAQTLGVRPEQILCGNGSDEILSFLFLAYGEQGFAFADITYGFYEVWAELYGVKHQIIPLKQDFTIDPDNYKTDAIGMLLANPNAPTGIALPLSAIEEICVANPGHIVVIDEAYIDFGAQSAVSLLSRYNNLIVVQTMSKSRQLAGGRLGYAVANENLIEDLNKIKFSTNPYNVNTLTQLAAQAAFADQAYFDACRQEIIANRKLLTDGLAALGFAVLPSQANFVFACHPRCSAAELLAALEERGILVRRFSQERICNYLRITVGTRQQMQALLCATEEILKS